MAQARRWARGEYCWYELGTTDPAGARKFYSGLFDWGFTELPMGPGASYTLFQVRGQDIGGAYKLEGPQYQGVPPNWLVYIATDRVDADTGKAKELGGMPITGPMDIPNVGRISVVRDPQGAVFGLFQAGGHEGSGRFNAAPNTFCWSELDTKDTAAAISYYTRLLGWGAKSDSSETSSQYTEWQVGGQSIGGLMQLQAEWGNVPPHWVNYIAVSDCDATVKRAEALGGRALVPPTDIPKVGRFSVLTDPQGAGFAVIKLG
jgi:uncharacterized protein